MEDIGFTTAKGDLDVIYDHAQMHFDRLERRKINEKWGGVALAVENMNKKVSPFFVRVLFPILSPST